MSSPPFVVFFYGGAAAILFLAWGCLVLHTFYQAIRLCFYRRSLSDQDEALDDLEPRLALVPPPQPTFAFYGSTCSGVPIVHYRYPDGERKSLV